MVDVYRTPIDALRIHDSGWAQLPSGVYVMALPFVDATRANGFARVTYRDAMRIADEHGAQLLTMAIEEEIWHTGFRLYPATQLPNSQMMGRAACDRHDARIWHHLTEGGWDRKEAVANCGKAMLRGALPGYLRQGGWFRANGHPYQAGGPGQTAHGDDYTDYSLLLRLCRTTPPTLPSRDTAPTIVPWADASLPIGVRACLLSAYELDRGVHEVTGRNDGPEIAKYFEGARRDIHGTPDDWSDDARTGFRDGWEWCAASLSWAAYTTHVVDDPPIPHGWRIAVWEIIRDLIQVGAWRPIESGYLPRIGDVCALKRAGEDPTKPGQRGHVCRVYSELDGGRFQTIDGNSGTTWRIVDRSIHDADIVGFGTYPRPPMVLPTQLESDIAARLLTLSKELAAGVAARDAIARILL